MTKSPHLEARVEKLEERMDDLTAETRAARRDAAAARRLAAAFDRDLANLTIKADANRRAINALGEQTRERFDAVDRRFDAVERRFDALERKVDDGFHKVEERFRKVDDGFMEIRGRLDATAAGLQHIAGLVTTLIDREGPETR